MQNRMRKHLSGSSLLKRVRGAFSRLKDPLAGKVNYSLTDCLMSGLAIFGQKYPSLLQFDDDRTTQRIRHNLSTLYGVKQAPCDTRLRERLDEVEPRQLEKAYKTCFSAVQRGKVLPIFEFHDDYFLVSQDGTGVFHSEQVHCDHCCQKQHRDGRVSYYHQMMSAVVVHPDQSTVLPLMQEPILKQDGQSKNDSERVAGKRLLTTLRRMHPKLKMVVVEDALHSNAPHIRTLLSLNYQYIIGAKPDDHDWLFDWVNASDCDTLVVNRDQKHYRFRWLNEVPLNASNDDIRVNFLEVWERDHRGKEQHFTWVTSFKIDRHNVYLLMKGARARWKVENETFNTLKNQGYHFEHNFGHGYHWLNTVFAHLMMLAFLIDQIQQCCCPLFQKALRKCKRRIRLWETMRGFFRHFFIESWEALYQSILTPPEVWLRVDSS